MLVSGRGPGVQVFQLKAHHPGSSVATSIEPQWGDPASASGSRALGFWGSVMDDSNNAEVENPHVEKQWHTGTVDGSEIPNNHLRCKKPW